MYHTDINECEGYNDCHQMCTNTDGSYYCSCSTGFVLAVDERTCGGYCTTCNNNFKDMQIVNLNSYNELATFNISCSF